MTFHPDHMHAGIKAALESPRTPSHLKPHLHKRLQGAAMQKKVKFHDLPKGPAQGKPTNKAKVVAKSTMQDKDPAKKDPLKDWSGISDMDTGFAPKMAGLDIDGRETTEPKPKKTKAPGGLSHKFYGK